LVKFKKKCIEPRSGDLIKDRMQSYQEDGYFS